jgi:hypothetical protein
MTWLSLLRGVTRSAGVRANLARKKSARLGVEVLEERTCLSVSIVASGLNNPRGLTFGPDGQIYIAEGGLNTNTLSTVGECPQVPAPVGPYTGGYTSRISKIDPATGVRTTVAGGLPSSQTNPLTGSLVSGVADVQFIGNTLYGLEAGAGCSHGLMGTDNTVFRVNADGSVTTVADLSVFLKNNPVANPNPEDFEPDGTWFSMVAVRGDLYAVEPNHGELDKITPDGQISRVIDISASQGHVVPTAVAYHGNFYIGNLGTFGHEHQPENIYKVTPSGQIKTVATGLSEVLGVAFDARARMYVLESSTGGVAPNPGTGDVVRFDPNGTRTVIVDHLAVPTAITFGPDGALYISNLGFGAPPGMGQVLRVDLTDSADSNAPILLPDRSASLVSPLTTTVMTEDMHATFDFPMLTLPPAGDSNQLSEFGDPGRTLATMNNGTELLGMDSGVMHVGANGNVPFTTTGRIARGMGPHQLAMGQVVATGVWNFTPGEVIG